jgi:cytochrome P450
MIFFIIQLNYIYHDMKNPPEYPSGTSQKVPGSLLISFLRDPITTMLNISRNYGDISHFKFGRKQHVYLLNHPDYIKDVPVTYNNNFIKSRGLQLAKRILGEGLLTSEGDFHYRQRQLIQPAFHSNPLTIYGDNKTAYAARMSKGWEDGCILDIHKELMHLTLAIVSKTLFSFDIESKARDIGKVVTTLVKYFNRARMPFGELIERLPIASNRQFQRARKQLDMIIYRMTNEHRINGSDDGKDDHHDDLISMLLLALDTTSRNGTCTNSSRKMTDLQLVRHEITTIFLAGHETVANALIWTF